MPAQNLRRENKEGIYSHIYNKGVEKRIIFNDEEDYEVFKGFLRDYLTAPQQSENVKKVFTVHGRTFRGIPHQPKNYFNKVELIAYNLRPDRFHLLLKQKTQGSLESFIRSLCTRYSIYFNKKYQRTGALFAGPYKSIEVKDKPALLHLTRYFHRADGYSSYAEYSGKKETSWTKPDVVLSFFGKGLSSYKDFVEKYTLNQKEEELIASITFESETQHLERRIPEKNVENSPLEIAISSEDIKLDTKLKPHQRLPEFMAATVVFFLLFGVGISNLISSVPKIPKPSTLGITTTVVSKTPSPKPSPTPIVLKKPEVKPKIILTVTIDDTASINIREKPALTSRKIGKAKNGDTFEFVSEHPQWYGVKLANGSTGYISAQYIKKGEKNN